MGTNFQVYARHFPPTACPILGIFFPFRNASTYVSGHRTARVTHTGRGGELAEPCVFQQKGIQRCHSPVNTAI